MTEQKSSSDPHDERLRGDTGEGFGETEWELNGSSIWHSFCQDPPRATYVTNFVLRSRESEHMVQCNIIGAQSGQSLGVAQ